MLVQEISVLRQILPQTLSQIAPVLLALAESSAHTFLESLEILVHFDLCGQPSMDLSQERHQEGTVQTKGSSLIFISLILSSFPPTRTLLTGICTGI